MSYKSDFLLLFFMKTFMLFLGCYVPFWCVLRIMSGSIGLAGESWKYCLSCSEIVEILVP